MVWLISIILLGILVVVGFIFFKVMGLFRILIHWVSEKWKWDAFLIIVIFIIGFTLYNREDFSFYNEVVKIANSIGNENIKEFLKKVIDYISNYMI